MATKTQPKLTPAQRANRRRQQARLRLNTPNTKITGKGTILYSNEIKNTILKNDELADTIIKAVEESNILTTIFEKANYIPIVEENKTGQSGPKRNFKSDADREKAREKIAARAEAKGAITTNARGRKVQDRKVVKGVPRVEWSIEKFENAGRFTIAIKTDDLGVGFQEAQLGKIGPKMKRKSKRNKKPEDGI